MSALRCSAWVAAAWGAWGAVAFPAEETAAPAGPVVVAEPSPVAPERPAGAAAGAGADYKPPVPTADQNRLLQIADDDMLSDWNSDGEAAMWTPWLAAQTGDGNAAEHFHRLTALYLKEKDDGKASVPADSRGVRELLAAAKQKTCRFSPDYYPRPETGDAAQPDYVVLLSYVRALLAYARERVRAEDLDGAEEAFRAGLLCGRHLTNDADSLIVYMAGLSFKQRAAAAYADYLRGRMRAGEAARLDTYIQELHAVRQRVRYKSQMLLGRMRDFGSLFSTARIALADKRAFWRQEAVMRLGVLRWGAPRGEIDAEGRQVMDFDMALQNYAAEMLVAIERNDPEPAVRRIAMWAFQRLTPESFVEIRQQALLVRGADAADAKEPARE